MEETLGTRHRELNEKTNATVKNKTPFSVIEAEQEHNDTDRLFKIDVASKYKNVPYIIETLKCKDDLYVSRALKCTWMFVYSSYIISPIYLEKELFPHMLPRSVNKMLLQIRIHLRDENRAELFYNHIHQRNVRDAYKWLPKCSVQFIEEKVENLDITLLNENLFKRLCEKSVKVFTHVLNNCNDSYKLKEYLKATVFVLSSDPEVYLDCFEKVPVYDRSSLNRHATKIILTKCPDRFHCKLDQYIKFVHRGEVAKILGVEATKQLVIRMSRMKHLKGWFHYSNIEDLLGYLREGKYDFIKQIFIDKQVEDELISSFECLQTKNYAYSANVRSKSVKMSNIYTWYKMAPFTIAFAEITNLIRTEASVEERVEMIKVLIHSARKNADNVHIVIKFIREKHINEPAKYKASIVGTLLTLTQGHKYAECTWNLLNEILHSLEFYTEEDNFHQLNIAVHTCIVRAVIHNKPIHDSVLKKFNNNVSTFNNFQKDLNDSEKDALYNFLRGQIEKKLNGVDTDSQALSDALWLLNDWNKNIIEDEKLMNIMRDMLKSWSCEVSYSKFYNKNKKWRRGLFEYSLQLVQTKDAYFNALKHKPSMILESRHVFDHVMKTGKVNLKKIMQKIRVYFPDTLAPEYMKILKEKLELFKKEQVKCKIVTLGICILAVRDEFVEILMEFLPKSVKIQWSAEDGPIVNIRKNLIQQMHRVRPTLNIQTVLLFSKGDYLQFGQSSLLSICSRMSSEEYRLALPSLLSGSVSLQKHGIRLAFKKLNQEEFMTKSDDIWSYTRNASIRGIIFTSIFDLLSRSTEESKINTLWALLKSFISKLTFDEDRRIYAKMVDVHLVPNAVKGEFCMMSYKFLNTLPPKVNCRDLPKQMISSIVTYIEFMDSDFVQEILSNYCHDYFEMKTFVRQRDSCYYGSYSDMINLLVAFTIYCKDKVSQIKKYEIMNRAMTLILSNWNKIDRHNVKVKRVHKDILVRLMHVTKDMFEDNKDLVNPKFVFKTLYETAKKELNYEQNYSCITLMRLARVYCESFAAVKSEIPTFTDDNKLKREKEVSQLTGKEFANRCLLILEGDIKNQHELLTISFIKSVKMFICEIYSLNSYFNASMLEALTEDPTNLLANVFAIRLLYKGTLYAEDELNEKFQFIRERLTRNKNSEIQILLYSTLCDY